MAVNVIHLWCWNFPFQVAPEFVHSEALHIMNQYHDDENDDESDGDGDDDDDDNDDNDDHHDDDEAIPGCLMRAQCPGWQRWLQAIGKKNASFFNFCSNFFQNFYMVAVLVVSSRNSTTKALIFTFTTILVPL